MYQIDTDDENFRNERKLKKEWKKGKRIKKKEIKIDSNK